MAPGSSFSRPGPRPDLIDEDPRSTLERVLRSEEARSRQQQVDLAEARNALARLPGRAIGSGTSDVARLTVEVAPSLVRSLLDTTFGMVRNHVISPFVGAALDAEMRAHGQVVLSAGRPKRALYHASTLDDPRSRERLLEWAGKGEVQRVGSAVNTEFCVFGSAAVVAIETWGDPASDYVVIRDPMLVTGFTALFDLAWDAAYPIPSGTADQDAKQDGPLLDLLGRGLKDEAIGRHLGWSLRTVRRRVARLMDHMGARTRFQLGAEAFRAGRLESGRPPPPAGRPAYRGQLGPRNDSR